MDRDGLSAETRALMKQLGFDRPPADEPAESVDELKVLFCSRTHSQLAQFSSELRRVSDAACLGGTGWRHQVADARGEEEPVHQLSRVPTRQRHGHQRALLGASEAWR